MSPATSLCSVLQTGDQGTSWAGFGATAPTKAALWLLEDHLGPGASSSVDKVDIDQWINKMWYIYIYYMYTYYIYMYIYTYVYIHTLEY